MSTNQPREQPRHFQSTLVRNSHNPARLQIHRVGKWFRTLWLCLTAEKGELVGALMGDKGTFKVQRRHGFYGGYDLSKYTRCAMSVCLGKDKDWGDHLASLLFKSYGVRGSTYLDGHEWRFWSSSTRAFQDLSEYYKPEWNCHSWCVTEPIFSAMPDAKEGVVRGYFDADGYPHFSKARNQVSLKATSTNRLGVESMKKLLATIGYNAGVYRRYSNSEVWELCIARQQDVLRFYVQIGFSIRRKQARLAAMLARKGLILGKGVE